MKKVIIVLTILTLVGCTGSRGFDRGALKQELKADDVRITDQDIKLALELKPQLSFPIKLGIYLSEVDEQKRFRLHVGEWRWNGQDKDTIMEWGNQLKTQGIVSDAFIISQATISGSDLKAIRLAAAQHGADAVLVLNGLPDVDRYSNPAAFLYVTIVGGFLVPGTHVDSLFLMNGALWDVRNQYLYLTVESEGQANMQGPGFVIKNKEAIEAAKKEALEKFGAEYLNRMISIRGK